MMVSSDHRLSSTLRSLRDEPSPPAGIADRVMRELGGRAPRRTFWTALLAERTLILRFNWATLGACAIPLALMVGVAGAQRC
jgi:hypothetical protein